MTNEQTESGELGAITDRELEVLARYQQYVIIETPERRKIWLADLARELLLLRAQVTPGTVESATAEFERQAAKLGRRQDP